MDIIQMFVLIDEQILPKMKYSLNYISNHSNKRSLCNIF